MVVVHVVEPFATGINTFIHELVFGMPDYEHIIVHGERNDTRAITDIKAEYKDKVRFIKWKSVERDIHIQKDLKAFFELRKILKNLNFDLLHLHSSKAGVIGRFIGYVDSYKNIIYTPNGASFLRKDISRKKVRRYESIERFFSQFNGKIVSSSESEYKAYENLDIRSKTIQNGVLVKDKLNNKQYDNKFKIVTCGKITIQKNPRLFNQIAHFFRDDQSVSFKWIGDGELKNTLKDIEITGWCSKEEVYGHLRDADLYLSTSSWEGLPFAGIEAMAVGLPLLMHDCVGNNDLVNPGFNGYLFNSHVKAIEDIEFLKENKETLETLSSNSKKMYHRHYDGFRCAKEYEDLYQAFDRKDQINNHRNK